MNYIRTSLACPSCGRSEDFAATKDDKEGIMRRQCPFCDELRFFKFRQITESFGVFDLVGRSSILNVRKILGNPEFVASWDPQWNGDDVSPALVYRNNYYIDIYKDGYHLILENQEFESQCLSELEYLLAEYVINSCGGVQVYQLTEEEHLDQIKRNNYIKEQSRED